MFVRKRIKVLALGLITAFLCTAAIQPVSAREVNTPQISLNQAIDMALTHSETVEKAKKEIERTEEIAEHRADQLGYIPYYPGTGAIEVPWAAYLTSDLQWRMSKKSLTAEEDAVAMNTARKYWNVLLAQKKVEANEKAAEAAQVQLRNGQLAYQVGMLNQEGLIGLETQYQAAQSSLGEARNNLQKAYAEFNQLVGLWADDRPVLTDNVNFTALEITNLEAEVNRVLSQSPAVWNADRAVDLQKQLQDMAFYTEDYSPYLARKMEVEKAEMDAQNTKELFANTTRLLYYTVKNLEENYAALQNSIKLTEEQLRVVKQKYELGMATKAEVTEKEKELVSEQATALELVCDHAYMKLAFAKPWAANLGS